MPVACVHDKILVECDEYEAEKVKAWLEKAMIDGMRKVLNGPSFEGPCVPVEVDGPFSTVGVRSSYDSKEPQ